MDDESQAHNQYLTGAASPNFDAIPGGLPEFADYYDVSTPAANAGSGQFAAVLPAAPSAPEQPADFKLPEGFTVLSEEGLEADGMPRRIRCEKDGAVMAWVPGGAFLQGIDGREPAAAPRHAVYLDGFYADLYEVTVAQYHQYRTENLNKRPEQVLNADDAPQMPALGVPWRDAFLYCKWAGKELPTEAEWEKAGRGSQGWEYPWGDGRAVWWPPRQPGQIDIVGSQRNDCSPFGIYDLAGNAREWCGDWFSADYYRSLPAVDGSPAPNPTGPSSSSIPNARVVKGAGGNGWHLWARTGVAMKEQIPDVGFRGVLRLPSPNEPARGGRNGTRSTVE